MILDWNISIDITGDEKIKETIEYGASNFLDEEDVSDMFNTKSSIGVEKLDDQEE